LAIETTKTLSYTHCHHGIQAQGYHLDFILFNWVREHGHW